MALNGKIYLTLPQFAKTLYSQFIFVILSSLGIEPDTFRTESNVTAHRDMYVSLESLGIIENT